MPPPSEDIAPPSPPHGGLKEVKYSLTAMLEEIKHERAAGAFAMEKLEQQDIKKLFKKKPRKRAKPKK